MLPPASCGDEPRLSSIRILIRSGFIAATLSVIARAASAVVPLMTGPATKQPRTLEGSFVLFTPQLKRGLGLVAEAEDRRHSVLRVGLELSELVLPRSTVGIVAHPDGGGQVTVGIDEPRHDGGAAHVDAFGLRGYGGRLYRPDRRDLAVAHHDGPALDHAAAAVDHARTDQGGRLRGRGGGERKRQHTQTRTSVFIRESLAPGQVMINRDTIPP